MQQRILSKKGLSKDNADNFQELHNSRSKTPVMCSCSAVIGSLFISISIMARLSYTLPSPSHRCARSYAVTHALSSRPRHAFLEHCPGLLTASSSASSPLPALHTNSYQYNMIIHHALYFTIILSILYYYTISLSVCGGVFSQSSG